MPTNISIVEDNDKLRATLAKVMDRVEGFRCVSHYGSAEAALENLPVIKPDVVLMDINLPGMNGVECVRKLKVILPKTQVMMLTVYEDTDNIFAALAAGASGYMLKRTPAKDLIEAIHEVLRGGSPMTTHIGAFGTRTAGVGFAGAGFDLQGNRRETPDQLRDCPHLHPAHLRKTSSADAHRGSGKIFATLTPAVFISGGKLFQPPPGPPA